MPPPLDLPNNLQVEATLNSWGVDCAPGVQSTIFDRFTEQGLGLATVTVLNVYDSDFPWPPGTKIDALVQIGHNAIIGENCLLCAHVAVGGSAEVGENSVLGGQVGVADNVRLGDGVVGGRSCEGWGRGEQEEEGQRSAEAARSGKGRAWKRSRYAKPQAKESRLASTSRASEASGRGA